MYVYIYIYIYCLIRGRREVSAAGSQCRGSRRKRVAPIADTGTGASDELLNRGSASGTFSHT